jgi:hypothetical protein
MVAEHHQSVIAVTTRSTGVYRRERHHPISRYVPPYSRPGIDYCAGKFVPQGNRVAAWILIVVNMQIRTADTGGMNPYLYLGLIRFRFPHFHESQTIGAEPGLYQRFHSVIVKALAIADHSQSLRFSGRFHGAKRTVSNGAASSTVVRILSCYLEIPRIFRGPTLVVWGCHYGAWGVSRCEVAPIVHGYGPLDDFTRRLGVAGDNAANWLWINRYGYLSDPKLERVGEVTRA